MRLARIVLALAGVALASCSAVLGMDAPTLETGADGSADSGADASTEGGIDAPSETSPEAAACAWDGGVDFVDGAVRCGGGCFAETDCTGTTPVCCQTVGAGSVAYACVASEAACGGYAIACVNENDCSGTDVCCHYSTHTICASSCTSGADIACLPGSADDCPTGKQCSVAVTDGDAAAPYYTCQP